MGDCLGKRTVSAQPPSQTAALDIGYCRVAKKHLTELPLVANEALESKKYIYIYIKEEELLLRYLR